MRGREKTTDFFKVRKYVTYSLKRVQFKTLSAVTEEV